MSNKLLVPYVAPGVPLSKAKVQIVPPVILELHNGCIPEGLIPLLAENCTYKDMRLKEDLFTGDDLLQLSQTIQQQVDKRYTAWLDKVFDLMQTNSADYIRFRNQ